MTDGSFKITAIAAGTWSRPTPTLMWNLRGQLVQQFETADGHEWRAVPTEVAPAEAAPPVAPEQPPMTPKQRQAAEEDAAVDALAAAMKLKLAKKRAVGCSGATSGEVTADELARGLRHHVGKGDPVDVAIYCAMIHARGVGIGKAPNAEARAVAILAAIKSHCSPASQPGDRSTRGAILWGDSEVFVIGIIAKALSE